MDERCRREWRHFLDQFQPWVRTELGILSWLPVDEPFVLIFSGAARDFKTKKPNRVGGRVLIQDVKSQFGGAEERGNYVPLLAHFPRRYGGGADQHMVAVRVSSELPARGDVILKVGDCQHARR
jgi:hypothetical protein